MVTTTIESNWKALNDIILKTKWTLFQLFSEKEPQIAATSRRRRNNKITSSSRIIPPVMFDSPTPYHIDIVYYNSEIKDTKYWEVTIVQSRQIKSILVMSWFMKLKKWWRWCWKHGVTGIAERYYCHWLNKMTSTLNRVHFSRDIIPPLFHQEFAVGEWHYNHDHGYYPYIYALRIAICIVTQKQQCA